METCESIWEKKEIKLKLVDVPMEVEFGQICMQNSNKQ